MILVTGATGKIGSRVVAALVARGIPVRAQVRTAERAGLVPVGADVVVASFEDKTALDGAVSGCAGVLLLSAPGAEQLAHETSVIEAVVRAGTDAHVVKIAALGMGDPAAGRIAAQHDRIRQALDASGLPWTALALSQLMDNLFLYAEPITGHGLLPVPAGDGRVAWVAGDDVAAVAVALLLGPPGRGETVTVTGPQALHHTEVAELLSVAVGRPVSYVDVPPPAAEAAMTSAGLPAWLAAGLVETNRFYAAGGAAGVSDAVPRLAETPGTTVRQFLEAVAPAFRSLSEPSAGSTGPPSEPEQQPILRA